VSEIEFKIFVLKKKAVEKFFFNCSGMDAVRVNGKVKIDLKWSGRATGQRNVYVSIMLQTKQGSCFPRHYSGTLSQTDEKRNLFVASSMIWQHDT
jgi:hypothetical protein